MKSLITLWNTLPLYPSPSGFLASSTKFLTVFGTVLPKRPISILPASASPILMSNHTWKFSLSIYQCQSTYLSKFFFVEYASPEKRHCYFRVTHRSFRPCTRNISRAIKYKVPRIHEASFSFFSRYYRFVLVLEDCTFRILYLVGDFRSVSVVRAGGRGHQAEKQQQFHDAS